MEVTLRMLYLPIRPALQELQIALVGIERKPIPFTACLGYFLVWVADIFKVQFPVLVRLVGQILRLAGNGVNLPACSAYFRDNPCIDVAP